MASNVSKHSFQWDIPNLADAQLEQKIFSMRVFDLDVKCIAAFSSGYKMKEYGYDSHSDSSDSSDYDDGDGAFSLQQTFIYELVWTDSENQPLQYKSRVRGRNDGVRVFAETKASPEGGHVSSSEVPPKGAFTLDVTSGGLKIKLTFEFSPPEDIQSDFFVRATSLFEENVLSDMVVVCGEKTFDCHKVILAGRSEVFRNMLTKPFKEAEEARIEFRDCDPDVATVLIKYLYSEVVSEDAITWELFDMAKMYQLSGLKRLCLRGLRKSLDVNSCCAMLEAAFKHDLGEMFAYAIDFLKKNKPEVTTTEGWKAVTENSELMNKIFLCC